MRKVQPFRDENTLMVKIWNMKSITQISFLKLALVPLTAAIAGTFLVLLIYFFQPQIPQKPSPGVYQDQIGLVQTDSQVSDSQVLHQVL